jgi:hypothetical protein
MNIIFQQKTNNTNPQTGLKISQSNKLDDIMTNTYVPQLNATDSRFNLSLGTTKVHGHLE